MESKIVNMSIVINFIRDGETFPLPDTSLFLACTNIINYECEVYVNRL